MQPEKAPQISTQRCCICLGKIALHRIRLLQHKHCFVSESLAYRQLSHWVCFAIFSSAFFESLSKHCFLSPESPLDLKDGAVKMGHSGAPYCCQIYSLKKKKTTTQRPSCKQDSTSCSVKSAAPPYVSLWARCSKSELGIDVINDHVRSEHIIIPCSFILSSVL